MGPVGRAEFARPAEDQVAVNFATNWDELAPLRLQCCWSGTGQI